MAILDDFVGGVSNSVLGITELYYKIEQVFQDLTVRIEGILRALEDGFEGAILALKIVPQAFTNGVQLLFWIPPVFYTVAFTAVIIFVLKLFTGGDT